MARVIGIHEEDMPEVRVRTTDIAQLAERREALLVEAERLYRLSTYAQEALTLWLAEAYDLGKDTRWHIDLASQTIASLPT